MKLFFKKIAIFILVLSFVAVPLTACGAPDKEIEGVTFEDTMFAYTGEDHSLLVTGDLPEGVTATYENNTHKDYGMYNTSCTLSGAGYITKTLNAVMTIYYDDQGLYDTSNYSYRNQLKDDTLIFSESEKAGTFSDGRTQVLLANQQTINDDSLTVAGLNKNFNSSKSDVDAYYWTAQEFYDKTSIESHCVKCTTKECNCRNKPGFCDSDCTCDNTCVCKNNKGYLVLESKKPTNRDIYLSLKPSCTLDEFLEADYLEFYMYLDTPSNRENQPSSMALYAVGGNARMFSVDLHAWVYVKIPLSIYTASRCTEMVNFVTSEGKGVKSKKGFYEYLSAGMPLLWTRVTFEKGEVLTDKDCVYKTYFSDLNLKVALPDDGQSRLSNNFTKLNETQYLGQKGKTVLKNIFPRYFDALFESDFTAFDGENVAKMNMTYNVEHKTSTSTLLNIMYMQVNPSKTYDQLKQYDTLAVTLYIDSQNPNPYLAMVSIPTVYATETKTLARFSANKWVTFEIPIEYILRMYAYLEGTQIYETPGTAYIWSNYIQELFYLTYEVKEFDTTTQQYKVSLAKDIYNARAKENITKWTDYPSRRETHVPKIQGSWIQYPMTVYLKSLKLIKKATA